MIEQRDKILKKYLENEKFSQNLTLKQKLIDEKLNKIIIYKEENIYKMNIKIFNNFIKLHRVRKNFFDKNKDYNVSVPQSFSQIINTVKKIAEEKNLKFYFVYLPEKKRYKYNLDKDEKYRNYSEVSNIIKEANIDLIDIKKEFYKISNPIQLYSKNGAHLNIEGYEKVAKFIFHKIQEFEK